MVATDVRDNAANALDVANDPAAHAALKEAHNAGYKFPAGFAGFTATLTFIQDGEAVSGFPEPPGKDPGDISGDDEPHHSLSNPVGDPDPTERPEHYDEQEDLEADLGEPPEGDRLDE